MIRVEQSTIQAFKPVHNNVLVRILSDFSTTPSGLHLPHQLKYSYEQSVSAEVLSPPRILTYYKKQVFGTHPLQYDENEKTYRMETVVSNQSQGMPWLTKQELIRGDIVWLSAAFLKVLDEKGDYLLCGEQKYYVYPYENIYLKRVGDSFKLLNGFILVAPICEISDIQNRLEKIGLAYVGKDDPWTPGKDLMGIVRYMGDIVEYDDGAAAGEDDEEISVGDTVILRWKLNRRLESQIHSIFSEPFIVTRRRNITAIVRDVLFE